MAESQTLHEITQTRAPLSAWVGVVLLFFLFGVIVFAVVGPSARTDSYEQTRAKKRVENLKALHEESAKTLTSYAWADKAKGTVKIPIEQAMQLTIADLSSKKVTAGGPIVAPLTTSAPAPAAATPSPAPSASPRGKEKSKATSVAGPQSENRGQPAAASNPEGAAPGTQPGANATPAASPAASTARPAVSPASNPAASVAAGSPLPVRGASPPSPSASPH